MAVSTDDDFTFSSQPLMAYNLSQIANEATAEIRRNPSIKASELAAMLQVSRRTLSRAFRESATSFRDIQGQALCRRVTSQLQQPGVSIKEIAVAAGYRQANSMSRRWRNLTGQCLTSSRKATCE
jgi:transcriptional regulator GlxA family with amidase domain